MPPKRKRSLLADSPKVSLNDDLGSVSVSSDDNTAYVVPSDDDDMPVSDGGAHLDMDRNNAPQSLLGLDLELIDDATRIHKLIARPISDKPPICHLRDVPVDAIWSRTNTLSDKVRQRAIVIVAFGSLTSALMVLTRGEPSSLTVAIEMFGETDQAKLQHIYDLAQPGQLATRDILAHRSSSNSRSRLLNVYDQSGRSTPKHRACLLSINELLGGDIVRMDMRCVRVQVDHGYRVEFKLKSLTLVVPMPRGVDIMQ